MLQPSLRLFALVSLVSSGFAWHARTASACTPPPGLCSVPETPWSQLTPRHAEVALDGVLVFELRSASPFIGPTVHDLAFTLDVRDEHGQEIEGEIEVLGIPLSLVFRPSTPLPAGESIVVTLVPDARVEEDLNRCGNYQGDEHTFLVNAATLSSLPLPTFALSTDYETHPTNGWRTSLSDLVCCDGAMPSHTPDSCGVPHLSHGSEGYCGVRRIGGSARALLRMTRESERDPSILANYMIRFMSVGEETPSLLPRSSPLYAVGDFIWSVSRSYPFEAAYELVNLVTGEIVASESIEAGHELDNLGVIELDMREELRAHCSGPAYTCEVVDGDSWHDTHWDPEACETFETDESAATGKGCSVGSSPSTLAPVALLLLGLVGARARRRIA